MKQDENEQNYKKGFTLVVGQKLNGKSRFKHYFLNATKSFYRPHYLGGFDDSICYYRDFIGLQHFE